MAGNVMNLASQEPSEGYQRKQKELEETLKNLGVDLPTLLLYYKQFTGKDFDPNIDPSRLTEFAKRIDAYNKNIVAGREYTKEDYDRAVEKSLKEGYNLGYLTRGDEDVWKTEEALRNQHWDLYDRFLSSHDKPELISRFSGTTTSFPSKTNSIVEESRLPGPAEIYNMSYLTSEYGEPAKTSHEHYSIAYDSPLWQGPSYDYYSHQEPGKEKEENYSIFSPELKYVGSGQLTKDQYDYAILQLLLDAQNNNSTIRNFNNSGNKIEIVPTFEVEQKRMGGRLKLIPRNK